MFTDPFQDDIPNQNIDVTGGQGYYIYYLPGYGVNCNGDLRKECVAVW